MTLEEYFRERPRGSKMDLASKLEISKTWLSLLVSRRKHPSDSLATMIEKYTKGAVTRTELRPDLYGEIT